MSDAVILQSGATFALSAALFAYVALQRHRTPLHAIVLSLLGAFLAWTGGTMVIFGSDFDPLLSRIAAHALFAGVMVAAPLWLFLCARLVRVAAVFDRPRAALVGLFTPTALTFTAFATDPFHGLFARGQIAEMFTQPPATWAGPFFWIHTLWSYACTGGGVALCLLAARRQGAGIERRRFLLVAAAAAVPLVSIGITLGGVLPPGVHLTPADLGVSAVLLVTAILRYRFLESHLLPASGVISHLRDALVLADADGVVVDANPAAERLLGRSLDALRGRALHSVVRDLAPDSALADQGESGRREAPPVQTVLTPDERVLDLSYASVGERGCVTGSFLVVRDRTEQHRAERSRHRSQRLESLGVLVAGIAHEINNPLAFVRTNLVHLTTLAGLVEKKLDAFDPSDAAALAEMSDVILETQGGADRISRLVDATRRLSREPGSVRALVDLNDVVDGALQMAALHAHRDVSVTTDLDPARPGVVGSAAQLGQVLLNLLINAKQAAGSQPDGRVRVETRACDGTAEVRVHDNGPGVSPADRERIFDPFFTTKDPDEGTGLGLAIAYDIAKDHGGSLEVGSSDLGGACFTLRLEAAPQ